MIMTQRLVGRKRITRGLPSVLGRLMRHAARCTGLSIVRASERAHATPLKLNTEKKMVLLPKSHIRGAHLGSLLADTGKPL